MPLGQGKIYTIDDIYTLPDGKRAELIDGNIYYMAPPSTKHQRYTLSEKVKVNIYDDLKIDLSIMDN